MEKIVAPLKRSVVDGEDVDGADVVEEALRGSGGETAAKAAAAAAAAATSHRLAVDHFLALSEEDKRGDNPAPESMSAWMQKKGMCELLDVAKLPARLTEARMRALAAVGEYVECFGQALSCGAVELGLAIAHGPGDAGWSSEAAHARALEKPARTSASSRRAGRRLAAGRCCWASRARRWRRSRLSPLRRSRRPRGS